MTSCRARRPLHKPLAPLHRPLAPLHLPLAPHRLRLLRWPRPTFLLRWLHASYRAILSRLRP
jgi:hypothetical protein